SGGDVARDGGFFAAIGTGFTRTRWFRRSHNSHTGDVPSIAAEAVAVAFAIHRRRSGGRPSSCCRRLLPVSSRLQEGRNTERQESRAGSRSQDKGEPQGKRCQGG